MASCSSAGEVLYNRIDTFVFFDLETSNLIRGTRMPRITELAMVATARGDIRPNSHDRLALPRIMHKLTIPVCPLEPISQEASFVSNLWNDTLENIKPFDETTYLMIMQFIERLPGLICFVAHNGNRFDYPVFLSEIQRLNKTLPDRILCVDTFIAFKEFFSDLQSPIEPVQFIPEGRDEVDEELLAILKKKESDTSMDDDWNDALCSVVDKFDKVKTNEKERCGPAILSCENGKDVLDAITNADQQTDCESTGSSIPKSSPKSMQAINEKTPKNQIIRNKNSSSRKILNAARKKLNFNDSRPKNFKLATVYVHMIGCEAENLHCAEADCISMLRCVCRMGPHFAEWADYNAVSINLFKNEISTAKN